VFGLPCATTSKTNTKTIPLFGLSSLRVLNPFGNIIIAPVPVDSTDFDLTATIYGNFAPDITTKQINSGEIIYEVSGVDTCEPQATSRARSKTPFILILTLTIAFIGYISMSTRRRRNDFGFLPFLAVLSIFILFVLPILANTACCRNVDVTITLPIDAFILTQTYHFEARELEMTLQPQTQNVKIVNGMSINGITLTEGPTYDPDNDALYFSEVDGSIIYTIKDVSSEDKADLSVWKTNSNNANGLKFRKGLTASYLYVCEFNRVDGVVSRYNIDTMERQVIAEEINGLHLGRPNDLTFDEKGRLYFTDRASSTPGYVTTGGVYRLDPPTDIDSNDTWSISKIIDDIHGDPVNGADRANGLVISPDDTVLYVIETNSSTGGERTILSYDLSEQGEATNKTVFHRFNPGRSGDGMTVDTLGNLYVNAGLNRPRNNVDTLDTRAGVHVFEPSGRLIDFIPMPVDLVTNVAFGGIGYTTLYANSAHKVFSWENGVKGTPR